MIRSKMCKHFIRQVNLVLIECLHILLHFKSLPPFAKKFCHSAQTAITTKKEQILSRITKPLWKYQYTAPTSGRKLYLLMPNELITAAPIISKVLALRYDYEYQQYNYFKSFTAEEQTNKDLELKRALREFDKLIKSGKYTEQVKNDIEMELHIVTVINMYCNQIFSDDGWKYIRKLISQANKRKKICTITVDTLTYDRLMEYAKVHDINTPNEAISQLLIDIKEIDKQFLPEKID
ncbi:hypothetical protein [Shewanella aestuarii]|uniref:Uncharacterized protein n=1 Tax=Shewanella aestuarii TaxID=1028752 RepID=A0A6G9QQ39_9GAMM|nr:hypothetical protein [Shewanella aestuarii]QIR16582.1 hypothetical protein HBH39_19090 [Shewanella aestuarii]